MSYKKTENRGRPSEKPVEIVRQFTRIYDDSIWHYDLDKTDKKEQLKLTKSRWKLLREHIGKNIIDSFQKTNQKSAEDEEQIELILEEANAYNLREEVKHTAKQFIQNEDILVSRVDAYLMAYNEWIK